ISLVERNVPLPFAKIANRRSLVNIWNLTDLLLVLGTPPAGPGAWSLSDERAFSTPELFTQIACAMGKVPKLWAVPPSVLRGVGRVLGLGAEIDRLTDSLEVDTVHTCATLRWAPRVQANDGIERTVGWYLTRNRRD